MPKGLIIQKGGTSSAILVDENSQFYCFLDPGNKLEGKSIENLLKTSSAERHTLSPNEAVFVEFDVKSCSISCADEDVREKREFAIIAELSEDKKNLIDVFRHILDMFGLGEEIFEPTAKVRDVRMGNPIEKGMQIGLIQRYVVDNNRLNSIEIYEFDYKIDKNNPKLCCGDEVEFKLQREPKPGKAKIVRKISNSTC